MLKKPLKKWTERTTKAVNLWLKSQESEADHESEEGLKAMTYAINAAKPVTGNYKLFFSTRIIQKLFSLSSLLFPRRLN